MAPSVFQWQNSPFSHIQKLIGKSLHIADFIGISLNKRIIQCLRQRRQAWISEQPASPGHSMNNVDEIGIFPKGRLLKGTPDNLKVLQAATEESIPQTCWSRRHVRYPLQPKFPDLTYRREAIQRCKCFSNNL